MYPGEDICDKVNPKIVYILPVFHRLSEYEIIDVGLFSFKKCENNL